MTLTSPFHCLTCPAVLYKLVAYYPLIEGQARAPAGISEFLRLESFWIACPFVCFRFPLLTLGRVLPPKLRPKLTLPLQVLRIKRWSGHLECY